jgi:hypothetical protein
MEEPGQTHERRRAATTRGIVVLAVALIAAGASIPIAARTPTWLRMRALKSPDAKVRRAAIRELGGREGYAAVDAIRAMITSDPSADVRQAAAYAAMKLSDRQAIDPICRAILQWPDDEASADMLTSLARLAGPTTKVTAFVDECARSGKPYRAAGAAMARAEWYQPAGIEELLNIGQSGPEAAAAFARDRLRQYLIPAAQMVGVLFDTTDPWPCDRFETMRSWWRRHGTARLLENGLWSKRGRDPDIHEIERLQHARERVGRKLGLL